MTNFHVWSLPDCDILYLVVTRSTWQVCKPGNMVVFPCFSCGILRGISKFRTLCQATSSTSATSTSTSGTSSSTSSTSLSTSSSTTSVSSSSSLTTSSTTGGWVGFFPGIVLVVSTELVLNPKKGCKPEGLVCAAGHSPKCLVDLVGSLSKGDHLS